MPGLGGTPTTAWPISKPPARAATIAIVAFFITGVAAIPVPAQEVVCSECHGDEPDHEAFAESVHALGTPVFPRRLFRTLLDVFGDACEILTVTDGGRPVASVLSFHYKDEVLPYYGGGLAAARECAGNDFMYWEVMRRAAERGARWFDFGRSKRDVGSYRFKKHWGFEPEPLVYEVRLVRSREVPNVNPLNPRYRMMVEAWKRLPSGLARMLGPPIARNLG